VIAPAILWIAALLATLPQMERLFARDDAEGGLDHLLMIPAPLPLTVLTKIAAALVLGARRGGVLIAILALPLAMPILIFGVATSQAAMLGENAMPPFQFLLAVVLLLLAITPWATAMSLRHAAE
jgi:heme exporter protein B